MHPCRQRSRNYLNREINRAKESSNFPERDEHRTKTYDCSAIAQVLCIAFASKECENTVIAAKNDHAQCETENRVATCEVKFEISVIFLKINLARILGLRSIDCERFQRQFCDEIKASRFFVC